VIINRFVDEDSCFLGQSIALSADDSSDSGNVNESAWTLADSKRLASKFELFIASASDLQRATLETYITVLTDSDSIDVGFSCNACQAETIIGNRYECVRCAINLCEKCELNSNHAHPFLKHKEVVEAGVRLP
jgi:hypothetical protein